MFQRHDTSRQIRNHIFFERLSTFDANVYILKKLNCKFLFGLAFKRCKSYCKLYLCIFFFIFRRPSFNAASFSCMVPNTAHLLESDSFKVNWSKHLFVCSFHLKHLIGSLANISVLSQMLQLSVLEFLIREYSPIRFRKLAKNCTNHLIISSSVHWYGK